MRWLITILLMTLLSLSGLIKESVDSIRNCLDIFYSAWSAAVSDYKSTFWLIGL
jgi:hypothetical protein